MEPQAEVEPDTDAEPEAGAEVAHEVEPESTPDPEPAAPPVVQPAPEPAAGAEPQPPLPLVAAATVPTAVPDTPPPGEHRSVPEVVPAPVGTANAEVANRPEVTKGPAVVHPRETSELQSWPRVATDDDDPPAPPSRVSRVAFAVLSVLLVVGIAVVGLLLVLDDGDTVADGPLDDSTTAPATASDGQSVAEGDPDPSVVVTNQTDPDRRLRGSWLLVGPDGVLLFGRLPSDEAAELHNERLGDLLGREIQSVATIDPDRAPFVDARLVVTVDRVSGVVDPALRPVLERIGERSAALGLRVTAKGYTSSSGPTEDNEERSLGWAREVADMLIEGGMAGSSVTVTPYGETDFLADNGTEAGRASNDRVEIVVHGALTP